MVIDCHAHVTAPQQLWAYRALLLANRGVDGPKKVEMTDEEIQRSLEYPEIGAKGHLELLKEQHIDLQLTSPRPFHLMHSERPEKLIHWFLEEEHNYISRLCKLYPETFRGIAALPQCAGEPISSALPELERAVKELGFVGCLINPDPYENTILGETPPMGDPYWYPLYEKMVELDIPGFIHATTSKSPRCGYSIHMINEESIAIISLLQSTVFEDFPTLKLIVPHGGGAIPYQIGRFEAESIKKHWNSRFSERVRRLYFDTVLYTKESIEFLIKTVGYDRCLFGTECPGVGAVVDQRLGRSLDDLVPVIHEINFLSKAEKNAILSENSRLLFKLN